METPSDIRERVLHKVRGGFFKNLVYELRTIWARRRVVLDPLIFSFMLLGFGFGLKYYCPWLFMHFGDKASLFSQTVLALIFVVHGVLISGLLVFVWGQDNQAIEAIRTKNKELFLSYLDQKIPYYLKMLIFFLSGFAIHSILSCDFDSLPVNLAGSWMVIFVVVWAWLAAYKMDNLLCDVWSIRNKIPDDWWEDIEKYLNGEYVNNELKFERKPEHSMGMD